MRARHGILVISALLILSFVTAASVPSHAQSTPATSVDSGEWQSLFDGKSLEGWRASDDASAFRVENGELLALGPTSHLFYEGPVQNHDFKNFELMLDVKTYANSNSGIYFHTKFENGWPSTGYEVQVNNSFESDPSRTGGLWGIQDNEVVPAKDGTWFSVYIKVEGKHILTKVDDKVIADYTEEPNPERTDELKNRLLTSGTIAFQAHHKGSEVHYRNIKIRPLP